MSELKIQTVNNGIDIGIKLLIVKFCLVNDHSGIEDVRLAPDHCETFSFKSSSHRWFTYNENFTCFWILANHVLGDTAC